MIKNFLNFILGSAVFIIKNQDYKKFINILIRANIICICDKKKDEKCLLRISAKQKEKVKRLCDAESIELLDIIEVGLPHFLHKYRRRPGIIVGILIVAVMLYVSSLFVWEINIAGNEKILESEMIDRLSDAGLRVGMLSSSVDCDKIYNTLMMTGDDLSWVSVNIRGTSANVEVLETESLPERTLKDGYSNIVARFDGQISEVELSRGRACVRVGDTVKTGDLLVSGVIDSLGMGTRYVSSVAKVYADVEKCVEIRIPLNHSVKTYQTPKLTALSLKILGKSINIFSNSSISEVKYDKIREEENLNIFNLIDIPVICSKEYIHPYDFTDAVHTEQSAKAAAHQRLSEELSHILEGAVLLQKEVNEYLDNDSYVIKCSLYFTTDIAQTLEFSVNY